MANFQTNMKEWGGGFAPPSTITAPKSDPWGELAAKLVPGAVEAVGRGYATAKGANVLGQSTTAEEALQAVEEFDAAVPFSDDRSNTADQKARIEDMKAEALRKYGTNDKKIQALVSAGKISTIEANARRHQLIQESLSNPVLAMFKDEFMEASTPFTGGPGLADKFFGAYMPTEEERVKFASMEKIVEENAAFEAQVQGVSNLFGLSTEDSKKIIREQNAQAQYLKQKENEYKLRNFTSHESYTVAMDNIDAITFELTSSIAARVKSGQKFDDPSVILAELEQARVIGLQKIAQYVNGMTQEDRRAVEGEFKKRLDNISEMVQSADGHEYFMKGLDRTIKGVSAREAQHTITLMNALGGPLYTMFKHSPELAKAYQGALGGDLAAEFKMKTDPLGMYIVNRLGLSIDPKIALQAGEKAAEGNKKWSISESIAMVAGIFGQGADGAKAQIEMSAKQPDVHESLLKSAFEAMPDGDVLSPYANSQEWITLAKTPEGAKTVASAIKTRVAQARSLQMRTGDIPTGQVVVREAPRNKNEPPGRSAFYEFHTPGIDPAVQKDMIQVIKIMRNSPLVVKELGVNSAEEYVNNYFLKK